MTTAFSGSVLGTLETLIAPGGRARISPFVENAQSAVLFPGTSQELRSIRNLDRVIRANPSVISRLATVWETFSNNKTFSDPKWYREQDFLDFYLAYYFPVNVAKLQINLLQYLKREGQFPTDLHVVEVGVGTGTTLIAIADFLLAWESASSLYGVSIPVSSVTYTGIDRSEAALATGKQVAGAYLGVVQANNQVSASAGAQVAKGLESAQWILGDARGKTLAPKFSSANLMILSYVLNELESDTERASLLEQSLSMSTGALLLVLEAGGKETATNLMGLRARVLNRNRNAFSSTGPCGDLATAQNLEATCSQCWNARQESLAEPQIYRAVRKEFQKRKADRRSFDEFQNRLLSWSYVWMTRGTPTEVNPSSVNVGGIGEGSGAWPELAALHYRRRIPGAVKLPAKNNGPECQPVSVINPVAAISAAFDVDLINAALKVKDTVDTSAIHKAMREKNYSVAEDLARRLLLRLSPVADGKAPYAPEHGPDGCSNSPESFLFCWHPRGGFPTEVVLPRPIGLQLPKLVHGDEVKIANAWYEQANNRRVTLGIDRNTVLDQTFLSRNSDEICSPTAEILDSLACRFFGFESLRPFQRQVIGRVLSGNSILAIAATGSGKSECFILPAMLSKGITIVVSPLLSLMTDQYEQRIRQRYGLDFLATVFNGSLKLHEKEARLRRLELGYYKLAYFTPEQLERDYILDSLRRANEAVGITYLVTDEAHCIAQWGHDFRPAYLNLYKRLRKLRIAPVRIALTATASPNVRKDICEELELINSAIEDEGDVYLESSNRPELNLIVRVVRDTGVKTEDIVSRLHALQKVNKNNRRPGAAIVFAPLTGGDPNQVNYGQLIQQPNGGRYSAGVAKFGSYLERNLNERVSIYHSKMDLDEESDARPPNGTTPLGDLSFRTRRDEQRAFIEGETEVMVATKGFGMGIDKDNIRLVLHRSPPSNLEAYAQEAGRAGRDGEIADVVLYYSPDKPVDGDGPSTKFAWSDHDIQSFFLSNKYIRSVDLELVHAMLNRAIPTHCGSFYVKTTDVIAFVDQANEDPASFGLSGQFEWPRFEDYPNRWGARGEHLEILTRGYWFDQVSNYVDRILQALYRIRPEIGGARRAFLSKVDECGTEIVWPNSKARVLAREVLESNSYFGQTMRAANLTVHELGGLILDSSNTLALAARLMLSLRETHSLLQDIKAAEHNALANFHSIRVSRDPPDLAGWRSRWGARTRVKPSVRAPTINDWFPWKAMAAPRGWEIRVGEGYTKTSFGEFLSGFCDLHNERERNDRNSYQRLLTDYVGVTAVGELRESGGERQCLRSVLLGYLGTNEVVVDGNCRSCSNCVSAESTLRDFSLEDRRQVVVRMVPDLVALFENLKEQADKIASGVQVSQLFDRIRREEAAGRSLRGYFAGWSGKILDETPGHLTGLWLRLEGARRELLPLDPGQFFAYAEVIARACGDEERERLGTLLLASVPQLGSSPTVLLKSAEVLESVGRVLDASRILGEIAESVAFGPTSRSRAASKLRRLHGPDGRLSNSKAWRRWTLIAAFLSDDRDSAAQLYGEATADHCLEEVKELDRTIESPAKRASLWFGWASRSDDRQGELAAHFACADAIGELAAWGSRAKGIYDLIACNEIIASPSAVIHYVSLAEGTKRPLLVGIIGLDRGLVFTERFIGTLATAVLSAFPSWEAVRADVVDLVPGCDAIAATERLFQSVCTSGSKGVFAAEMGRLLISLRHDSGTTIRVLGALSALDDESVESCAPLFLELANRAQSVEPGEWARVLKPSPRTTGAVYGLAQQLFHLLAEALKSGGPSLEAHAASVETLAARVPDSLVSVLRKITDFSNRNLDDAPRWLRALASVRDREGDASGELELWLKIAGSTPLAPRELSRALGLVMLDTRLNTLTDKVGVARKLVGDDAVGERLADVLCVVLKSVPLGEFSAFTDSLLDIPDVWVAAWASWLSANPAITHFQCSLKRNERWATAMREAAEPSRLLVFKYLPNEFIEASPEFRLLLCGALGTSREAIATVAQWLRKGIVITIAEEQAIKAFVSVGADNINWKSDVDNSWVLFERFGELAFAESNLGIERWIPAIESQDPKVVEARLNMLVDLLTKTSLDKALVRIAAKLKLAIDNSEIGQDAKERVRAKLRLAIRTLASSDKFLLL